MAVDQARLAAKIISQPKADIDRQEFRPRFEIPADARTRRQQRLRFLRSRASQHRKLADSIDGCTRGHRCKSEADPVCAGLYWQKVRRAVNPVLGGKSWTRALIVTAGLSKPYGRLGEFDLAAAVESVRERFARSGLRDRIIIGVVDISLCLRNGKIIGWQLHLDLLIEGNDRPRLQKAIEAAFPAEPKAPRPYLFANVTDPEKTLAQLYTSKFFRRSWHTVKRKVSTAKLPLTASDLQELLAFLGGYPVGARLLRNGLLWDGNLLVPARMRSE
jgi:hypothetical protein